MKSKFGTQIERNLKQVMVPEYFFQIPILRVVGQTFMHSGNFRFVDVFKIRY